MTRQRPYVEQEDEARPQGFPPAATPCSIVKREREREREREEEGDPAAGYSECIARSEEGGDLVDVRCGVFPGLQVQFPAFQGAKVQNGVTYLPLTDERET